MTAWAVWGIQVEEKETVADGLRNLKNLWLHKRERVQVEERTTGV